ncbi:MAG: prepilin-type N-terminal cleavage/methylation domain-containing protein [Isosphaeraceae bacterium]
MTLLPVSRRPVRGFTLVELAVVVVIIGVLAAFGVPKFLESVERSKASEAFAYLAAVRTAQERFMARMGRYGTNTSELDFAVPQPKYFSLPDGNAIDTQTGATGQSGATDGACWSLTLTRSGSSAGYKGSDGSTGYTVVFTQDGFFAGSSIPTAIRPVSQ